MRVRCIVFTSLLLLWASTAGAENHVVSPKVGVFLACPLLHKQADIPAAKVQAPVLVRFRGLPGASLRRQLTAHGVELMGRVEEPLHLGLFFPARVTRAGLQALAACPLVRRVDLDVLLQRAAPLDLTVPEVEATNVWTRELAGVPLAGKGVTIGSIDSGVDPYHPAFFRGDGGLYPWIDVDGDGVFVPGKDAVDLDGDGKAGSGETLRLLDTHRWIRAWQKEVLTEGVGKFEPERDWLWADTNDNQLRDSGPGAGFDDGTPGFGEPLFVAEDLDRDGKLDPGEKLRRLKTSKVQAVWKDGSAFQLGQDLTQYPVPEYASHGTGTTGIMLGGQRDRTALTGIAPEAALMMAETPRDGKTPISNAIIWLSQAKVDVMLHEYAPWTGYHLDGSSNHESLMDQAAALGIAQVTPAGNLGGTDKHMRVSVAAGGTATVGITVPGPNYLGTHYYMHLTLLWRDLSAPLAFELTDPAGTTNALPEDNSSGKLWGDGKTTFYSYRDDSSRGTAMLDLILFAGTASQTQPIAQGAWTLTIKHPGTGGSVQVLGYVSDAISSWAQGIGFAQHSSQEGLVCFPATADSAITVAAYAGHVGSPYEPNPTGDKTGDLRAYSSRGLRVDGAAIMDIAAPDNPLTPLNGNLSFAGPADFQVFGGTSGAGPHVAGAAALVKQQEPALSGTEVRNVLRKGALADAQVGTVPSTSWGYGKLRIFQALFNEAPRPNTRPTARIKPGGEVHVGEQVVLQPELQDAEDSADQLLVRWDEGYDGTWDTSFAKVAPLQRTYSKPGTVWVKLQVKDSGGLIGEAALRFDVLPAIAADGGPPGAGDGTPTSGGEDGCSCEVAREPGRPVGLPWWGVLSLLLLLVLRRAKLPVLNQDPR